MAAALAAVGLPVAVVNSRQARDFAKATGPVGQNQSHRCTAVGVLLSGLLADRYNPRQGVQFTAKTFTEALLI